MKRIFAWILFISTFAAVSIACQEDENAMVQNPQNLSSNSQLTSLLRRVAEATAGDNVIDSTSCFSVKMPFTVNIASGQGQNVVNYFVDVTDAASLGELKATIAGFEGEDHFSLVFPVTIVYNDGSQLVVNDANEMHQRKTECDAGNPANLTIPCLSVVYPVTVFSYDSNFQVADTFTFDNDSMLLAFLDSLQADHYYAIDYPVQVTVGGNIIEIGNNAAFLSAMQSAIETCNPVETPCGNPGILTDSLIIYMPIADEAKDLISGQYALSNDNFPAVFSEDRDGNAHGAVSFSGAPLDYLKLMSTTGNNIEQGPVSFSLWFKMNNTNPSDFEHLLEKSDGTSAAQNDFGLAVYDLNRPLFYTNLQQIYNVWDGSWNVDADNAGWHHLVATVETGSVQSKIKLYRDGNFIGASQTPQGMFVNSQVFDYYFGRNFKGSLDDIRVYSRLLSAAEVQILFELEGDINTCVN
ncbi:MAG: hypothetical protein CFE23_08960 [Flavobacterium sp. BFFFF1]|uniref:LamG domain-containing protein n=1 Tax=Flavobacterium sp. BFFFF1 TaxID=2015557 RepID=UPI000BC3F4CE|nr:LamG domain-containing protein [Flavobacterium sp. BFFFF1]OYU80597.1 MAG: hypothetical protein CFE23_08960 [Flavobacterium sp. BFFFF1]